MTSSIDLERLRSQLRAEGRSQSELARRLGLHPSAVNKMLAGTREIKLREFMVIEAYLAETAVIEKVDGGLSNRAVHLREKAAAAPGRAATWLATVEIGATPGEPGALASSMMLCIKENS